MIKILLVDDHAMVREGLRQFLDRTPDIRIVGEAPDAATVFTMLHDQAWDLIMLDIALPDQSGIEVLRKIKCDKPDIPVLIFSGFAEDVYALECMKAGAAGYLVKDCAPDDIRHAIRSAVSGEKYISPKLANKLLTFATTPKVVALHEKLSGRELEVMLRIGRGKKLTAIAAELNVSVKTISTYRTLLLRKMGMSVNTEIVRYIDSNGLDPNPPQ